MCKVYNSIGSLTTIKSHLYKHGINEFNSLSEIITFQKNYYNYQKQIISNHEQLIEQEKDILSLEILQLETNIKNERKILEDKEQKEINQLKQELINLNLSTSRSFIRKFIYYLKELSLKKKIKLKELEFDSNVTYSIQELTQKYLEKINRYNYITFHFKDAVNEICLTPLKELERKKTLIDEINTSIYGAFGEQKVVKELKQLSDEYFLINDFNLFFPTPIYNRNENDYIKSIQIDHILISTAGIFLIETKNWSEESLNNLNLRSPVQQIKRANFALFKIINEEIEKYPLNLKRHHWGDRKIPLRNLIVLTNIKPKEEFQYVKTLTLNELTNYIKYFKPLFSNEEVEKLADFLLLLNDKN